MVFTDAARYVTEGASPYERATYRYSPFLAFLLTPNVLIHPVWGKILFAISDLVAGFMIKELISRPGILSRGVSIENSHLKALVCLWLYNPIVINVSTRGNAEALVSVAVLSTLYALQCKRIFMSGLLFGLSIHLKLYPVIYSLALLISIGSEQKIHYKQFSLEHLVAFMSSKRRWVFLSGCMISFTSLSGIAWFLYGFEFIQESFLYHVIRADHRHNFSIYFYQMYLEQGSQGGLWLGLVAFVPQIILLLALTYRYAVDDIGTCICLQTIAFVALNKVCTVQYWVWYMALLPLCLSRCRFHFRWWIFVSIFWSFSVASWLLQAYRLEMLGVPTWPWLVVASGLLLTAHMLLLGTIAANTRNRLLDARA
jgi:phosphatidylinositol glycan class M